MRELKPLNHETFHNITTSLFYTTFVIYTRTQKSFNSERIHILTANILPLDELSLLRRRSYYFQFNRSTSKCGTIQLTRPFCLLSSSWQNTSRLSNHHPKSQHQSYWNWPFSNNAVSCYRNTGCKNLLAKGYETSGHEQSTVHTQQW